MAYAGHALLGDQTYGNRRKLPEKLPGAAAAMAFPRQALHAATLGFVHPVTGEALEFASPLPDDMVALISGLDGG
jgi:23S rRNA pseudouridine1911/1915/1917 synthase